MDQAMGDLQAQLEEMRRLWEEERAARTRAESELDVLRGLKGSSASADSHATSASAGAPPEKASEASAPAAAATTSASDGETTQGGEEESGRPGKRQRTD
jgi:bHLH factor